MHGIFLAAYGPLLVVLHAVGAIVLGGSSVHHAVLAVRVLRGRAIPLRLARLYSLVALCAYLWVATSGSLLYPRYRYFVRGLYLDRYAPWASNLFDFKENLATLGLPLALGALLLARGFAPSRQPQPHEDRQVRVLYGFLALGTALIAVFNLIAGLVCTSVHGI